MVRMESIEDRLDRLTTLSFDQNKSLINNVAALAKALKELKDVQQ